MIFCRISRLGKNHIGLINKSSLKATNQSNSPTSNLLQGPNNIPENSAWPHRHFTCQPLLKSPPNLAVLLWKVSVCSIKSTTPSPAVSCRNRFACPHSPWFPLDSPCTAPGRWAAQKGGESRDTSES